MRFIYATDLHGNAESYEALLRQAVSSRADAVVLGGDLLTHDALPGQTAFMRSWLAPRLRRFHEAQPAIRVFGLLGNDDWGVLASDLEALEPEGALAYLHQKAHPFGDNLWIAGSSFVPVTPFGMSDWDRLDAPRWQPPLKARGPYFSTPGGIIEGTTAELAGRAALEEALADLAKASTPARTVYVLHTPPWGTKLDQVAGGKHIGSRAVRSFIERHQPPLALHGHIHESPSVSGSIADTLGKGGKIEWRQTKDARRTP
ncbi:MAG: metallophosphoesterase [Planctomycetota bacterium]|nr:metallophosphoesterase [Planctomycetota bacterium]